MIRPFVRESLCRQVANLNRCCRFCRPRPPGPAMPGPAPVFRRRRPTWPGPGPGIIAILWGIHWIHGESYDHSIRWRSITFPLWILGVSEFWRTFAWAWKKRLMSTNIHSVKWPLPGRHCTAAGGQQPKQPETCLVIVRDVHDRSVKGDFMLILWWFGDDLFCHPMSSSWSISGEVLEAKSVAYQRAYERPGRWWNRCVTQKGTTLLDIFWGSKWLKTQWDFWKTPQLEW